MEERTTDTPSGTHAGPAAPAGEPSPSSPARGILTKAFILATGAGAARILGMGTFIILGRALGVRGYGVFTYAMSVAQTVGVLVDMGQTTHLGRVVAADPENGPRHLAHVAVTEAALTVVAAAGIAVVASALGAPPIETATLVLMMLWVGIITFLDAQRAVSRSLGRFDADSVINGSESALRLALVLGVWGSGTGLLGFGAAFVAEAGASVAAFQAWLARRARLAPIRFKLADAGRFFAASAPLGLNALALTGFYLLDQVFVRALAGTVASGLYGAAARVLFAANMVGGLVATAIYPELVRLRDDPVRFRRHLATSLMLTTAMSGAVAVVVFVFAGPILSLFGESFTAAEDLLRVLAPIIALNGPLLAGMAAANALEKERTVLVITATLLAANIVANILLVPTYGAMAAAWISLIGEALMAVAMVAVAWTARHVPQGSVPDAEA